jgi:hypothetical protein
MRVKQADDTVLKTGIEHGLWPQKLADPGAANWFYGPAPRPDRASNWSCSQ